MKVSGMGAGLHKCELCGETFQFTSIYSTGDPPQLTVAEFFSGIWPMIKNTFSQVAYHGTLAIIWLVIAPLLTAWFLDISLCIVFRRNFQLFSFLDVIFRSPTNFLLSWWNGVLATSTILVSMVVIYYLYITLKIEYLRRKAAFRRDETRRRIWQEFVARRAGQQEAPEVHDERESQADINAADSNHDVSGGGMHVGFVAGTLRDGIEVDVEVDENAKAYDIDSDQISPSADVDAVIVQHNEALLANGIDIVAAVDGLANIQDVQLIPDLNQENVAAGDIDNVLRGIFRNGADGNEDADADADALDVAAARDLQLIIEPTTTFFLKFIAINALLIVSFVVLPVLIGRLFLSLYSIPQVYLDAIGRSVEVGINEQKVLLSELVVIFDLSSSESFEISNEVIYTRVIVVIEAVVGFSIIFFMLLSIFVITIYSMRRSEPTRELLLMLEDFWHRSSSAAGKWSGFVMALGIHLAILPQIIGWLIDIALLPAFGASLRDRLAFFSEMFVLSLIVHWLLGLAFMVGVSFLLTELREVIRHDLLVGILPSPHREDENAFELIIRRTFKENLTRSLMRTVFYTIFVLLTISIPVRVGHYICPCLKPLVLNIADAVFEIQLPLEMVFLHVLVPLAMDHLRVKAIVHDVMQHFFLSVCTYLDITEILEHPPVVEQHNSSSTLGTRISFSARVVLCSLVFMTAIAVAASWIIHAPLTLGRGAFLKFGIRVDHDALNYIVGSTMVFIAVKGSRAVCRELGTVDLQRFTDYIVIWTVLGFKIMTISSVWLTIIPLLIGIGFESIAVVPLRTATNETPRYPLLQCWAVGLVFLKIWTRCIFLGGENRWRPIFEQVLAQGIWNVNMMMIFSQIVFPVFLFLADFILVPYFITRSVSILLGWSYDYRTFAVRYSFIGFAAFRCLFICLVELVAVLTKLHNDIRDSRYLVGTQLTNRG